MLIDKAIAELELLKKNTFSYMSAHQAFVAVINTMKKYQKIKEILKDDTYYEEYGNNAEKFIVSAISEVLEDGNNKSTH